MAVIGVPYHLDEYLPDLDFPLEVTRVIRTDLRPYQNVRPPRQRRLTNNLTGIRRFILPLHALRLRLARQRRTTWGQAAGEC